MGCERFHFPATDLPGLIGEKLGPQMEASCTPMGEAKPGDLVGFTQDFRSDHIVQAYPITRFLRIGTEGQITRCTFFDLEGPMRAAAAELAMVAQSEGFMHVPGFFSLCEDFDAGDGETIYLNLAVFRDFSLLALENYHDDILNGRYYEEDLAQEAIDDCFTLVAHEDLGSAHQRLRFLQGVRAVLPSLSRFVAISQDPSKPGEFAALDLPEIPG